MLTLDLIKNILTKLASKKADANQLNLIAETIFKNRNAFKHDEEIILFIGHCKHETIDFEIFREKHNGDPIEYFQNKYGHKKDLGNTQEGDCARFKGRGLIQITGRDNYDRYAKQLGETKYNLIMNNPEILESDVALGTEMSILYGSV